MRTVKDEMKAQDGKIKGCSKKVVEAQQAASRIQSQQRGTLRSLCDGVISLNSCALQLTLDAGH